MRLLSATFHRTANALVGNPPGAASLEITITGPTLEFSYAGLAAVSGGGFAVELRRAGGGGTVPIGADAAFSFQPGDVLAIGTSDGSGCRCYLALAGGIDVPEVIALALPQPVAEHVFGLISDRTAALPCHLHTHWPGASLAPGMQQA